MKEINLKNVCASGVVVKVLGLSPGPGSLVIIAGVCMCAPKSQKKNGEEGIAARLSSLGSDFSLFFPLSLFSKCMHPMAKP